MKKKSKKWVYFILLLLILGLGFLIWNFYFQQADEESINKIFSVTRSDIQKSILTTGLVQPYNRLEIKPPIAGRAEEVLVNEGDRVTKGQILAWMSSTERAVLLDAARAQGSETLKYWETLYKPTPLIAPLDGMIIAKTIQSGQTVTGQDPVLVMSDKLIVKAQVDETDMSTVRLGQKAEFVLDAYSQQKIQAHVDHIAFEAKTVNNVTVYEVDVLAEEIPEFMRSGMTANVTFYVENKSQVLTLPLEAISHYKNKNFVWQTNPQDPQNPIQKEIQVGLTDGKKVEILSGLQEGEKAMLKNKNGKGDKSKTSASPLGSPLGTPRH
ncbi:MAG: efflux RND transporter periplasmic adaptor subunit [Deltaproteobacteria bacterium]|nr:efflux RND transporter periplasmic adaptor subunit [Deltaproteobacteria bacterium]